MAELQDLIAANWPLAAAAVVALLLAIGWLLGRRKTPRERYRAPDALDEGAEPAARNQALIDAPSAATVALAEPVPVAAPARAAPGPDTGDDLARIKGLGPKLQALLPSLGITSFAQIAALSEADLDALDARLGAFAGRPRRDSWVDQAKFLAAGDTAGFEGKFGKV